MNCKKNISNADVLNALRCAKNRVVFLAPGIDEEIAKTLSVAWQQLGSEAVTVVLDIDPEVIRLGYGTLEGLALIQKTAAACGQTVCHQPGIRICVVIVDGASLIFTPTPLLIEAGSTQSDRPNGIILQSAPKSLGDELGVGEEGIVKRTIGLEPVSIQRIEAVQKDLQENPALKFDISRKERVFNAKLEFVEFELEGCFISRQTVTIPPELIGMARMDPKTRSKLRSSFRLVEQTDILDAKKKISEKALLEARTKIARKYLVPLKGYGTVILRINKNAFEKEVEDLGEMVKTFRDALREKLDGIFETNAKRLTKALLPSVAKNPPEHWTSILGGNPGREEVGQQLSKTLLQSFGDPESILKEMRVNLVFKGITYGTLTDHNFIKQAAEAFPKLQLHEEYHASRGSNTLPDRSSKQSTFL